MNARRLAARVATALRCVADWLDPAAKEIPYVYGGSSDLDAAERMTGVMQLRAALRRYQPPEPPGQA